MSAWWLVLIVPVAMAVGALAGAAVMAHLANPFRGWDR